MANEIEKRRWNDEDWARAWPKREAMTDRVTPVLLHAAAPRAGERIVDVGCGGGKTTIAAAGAVAPDGQAIGVDLSRPILELARRRADEAGAGNTTFLQADAQTDALGDGDYDAAISQFGIMFFEDPVAAFANIGSHLRPAGRLVFACWQPRERNAWFAANALAPFVPAPPPVPEGRVAPGPFAFGDADYVTGILTDAKFTDIRVEPHDAVAEVHAESLIDDAQLVMLGVAAEDMPAARAAVERHLAQFGDPHGTCRFPLAFQIVSASTRR